jgi:hypothetical protein
VFAAVLALEARQVSWQLGLLVSRAQRSEVEEPRAPLPAGRMASRDAAVAQPQSAVSQLKAVVRVSPAESASQPELEQAVAEAQLEPAAVQPEPWLQELPVSPQPGQQAQQHEPAPGVLQELVACGSR